MSSIYGLSNSMGGRPSGCGGKAGGGRSCRRRHGGDEGRARLHRHPAQDPQDHASWQRRSAPGQVRRRKASGDFAKPGADGGQGSCRGRRPRGRHPRNRRHSRHPADAGRTGRLRRRGHRAGLGLDAFRAVAGRGVRRHRRARLDALPEHADSVLLTHSCRGGRLSPGLRSSRCCPTRWRCLCCWRRW